MIKLIKIISESSDQFEFEYSETGNQFEFGLRDNYEEEFAAESIGILNDKDLHIESFGTNPKYRKQGLGSRLMNKIIDFAKTRKMVKIALDVRSSNKAAVNLYKKFGFNSIDKRRGDTLDKMELVLGISEIKSMEKITPEMVSSIYDELLELPEVDVDEILNIFVKNGYDNYLEKHTQPGRKYTFYDYLQDNGGLDKVYAGLIKVKNKK